MTNHNHIKILSEHLANQIAAGEVVQRPESVVKELVENSIDAGAKTITVVVKEAGKQLIHIIDDGKGMSVDDLELSIVRHATSKISSIADLHNIMTLGFRGEALASVAAVADVEIRTRTTGAETGWSLTSQPGGKPELKPIVTDVGSQMFVRNLFYTTPARKKFLKSDLTEFRHISETMQRLALGNPNVRFVFYDGSNIVFDVPVAPLKQRIADVLSIDPSRQTVTVSGNESGIQISGVVGLPSASRQSRSGQFLFLNGRSIVSRSLAHAIASSYDHLLDNGQHPVFVVSLTIDPHRVDVNVHPQKNEVKFDDERAAYLAVQHAVSEALRNASVIPSFLGELPLASRPLQSLEGTIPSEATFVNRFTGEILTSKGYIQQGTWSDRKVQGAEWSRTAQVGIDALYSQSDAVEPSQVMRVGVEYVATTSAEGIVLIHKRRAHERILYERAMKMVGGESGSEQAILFSSKFSLTPSRAILLKEFLHEFVALGFKIEVNLDGTVSVHAVPTDVKPGTEEAIIDEILQEIERGGSTPSARSKEKVAAAYASRQSFRKGETITENELKSLTRELFNCSVSHITPKGEPTFFIIPYIELRGRFE
ncbi:MAG: DNA mismatch repair endonuclease MutL [Ignavibacteria bacterium]|nr:DNA mismatch repair endonuclease MutL [Ignavibacteria bacterium]